MNDEVRRIIGVGKGTLAEKEAKYTLDEQPKLPDTVFGRTLDDWMEQIIVPPDYSVRP